MNHKRLYVGDLSSSVTEAELNNLFSEAGSVESVNLVPSASHDLHGYAFIEMSTPEDAREAVLRFNGHTLDGSRLIVYTVPPRSRPRPSTR
jgi:RNA recognition motif-containing protein